MYFLRLQTSIVWFLSFLVKDTCACVKTSNSFVVLLIFWIWLYQFVCLVDRICGVRASFQPNSVAFAKIRLSRISTENIVQPAEYFKKSGWGVYLQQTKDYVKRWHYQCRRRKWMSDFIKGFVCHYLSRFHFIFNDLLENCCKHYKPHMSLWPWRPL